jgi:ribonuclease HI
MLAAIDEERAMQAIRPIRREEVMWEHETFFVKRKGKKKLRKVVDCSALNVFLRKRKFKMEDHRVVQKNLIKMMWATKTDISNAYLQVPVDPEATPFLCFNYDGQTWTYTAMPFGLSTAPRTFTLLMRACIKAIREKWEVTATAYLDDLLFLHADRDYLEKATVEIVCFLEWLGWEINREKSDFLPKQVFEHLGWQWDTTVPSVCLPPPQAKHKLQQLRSFETTLLTHSVTSARSLARTIGDLGSSRFQLRQASLHLRTFDSLKLAALAAEGWDGPVLLPFPPPEQTMADIDWWRTALTANEPRSIAHTPPQAIVYTDASPIGWGAHVLLHGSSEDLLLHGRWRKKKTSNALECTAVERALRTLKHRPEGRNLTSLVVRTDNTATAYNINRLNACDSLLPSLLRLLHFLDHSGLEIVAEHVAGTDNTVADKLSRISPGGDYSVTDERLDQLLQDWGVRIGADLFAAGWNAKHSLFFSPERDRRALGRNAFLARWADFPLPLIHPPLPLLPRVLQRLLQEKMMAIIIAPDWRREVWSNLLASITIRKTVLGSAETVLVKGKRMGRVHAQLPPGNIAAYMTDTRTTPASYSSTNT